MLAAIGRKRDGEANTADDLRLIAQGAADSSVPDYQLSAWLMAAVLNGLDAEETAALTMAMAASGERLDLAGLPKPWLDKHSTGGVGDKTTLVLLPLLAACGLTVVKMSGRGLGITGGTIDKLESVPGMRLDLTPEDMKAQARDIGLALTGQTPRLAPADGRLYALRDVTGTVASIPLITSSILSKKIAGGAEALVLDVKCGSGAFMRHQASAKELAESLVSVGKRAGLRVRAEISDMDQPLGAEVGNALEVKEAIRVLSGQVASGPSDRFRELCLHFARLALGLAGRDEALAESRLADGTALAKAKEWFAAQGGSLKVFASEDWGRAAHSVEVLASASGFVERVDAGQVGELAVELGAGRRTKADAIDHAVGVTIHACVGDAVEAGQPLATVHFNRGDVEDWRRRATACFTITDQAVSPRPVILGSG